MFHIIEVANAGVISDAPKISTVLTNSLFFLLSIIGIIAILMTVVSGIMYFISIGDEGKMEKAKSTAKTSFIGIIMAMSSMIIVKIIQQFLG